MRTIVFFILLFFSHVSFSQEENSIFYSELITDYSNKTELPFLNYVENKVLESVDNSYCTKHYNEKNNLIFVSAFWGYFDCETVEGIVEKHGNPKNRTNNYETFLLWNNTIDTCNILSFSREYKQDKIDIHGNWDPIKKKFDTTVTLSFNPLFALPINTYDFLLKKDSVILLEEIIQKSVNEQLALQKKGALLISEHHILIPEDDSASLLPQAPIYFFSEHLLHELIKEAKVYSTPDLSEFVSKEIVENRIVSVWDSTNKIEDPYHPGDSLLAPIKTEFGGVSITIIEAWKYLKPVKVKVNSSHTILPFTGLSRFIYSIGIQLSNHQTIYFSYHEIKKLCKKHHINFEPYNQLFTAICLKKLNLQTY